MTVMQGDAPATAAPGAVNGQAIARPDAGEVQLVLAGRSMVMRPTFTAISEAEQLTGRGFLEIARHLAAKRYGVHLLAAIVAPGLKAGSEPGATVEKVAELIYQTGLTDVELVNAVTRYVSAGLNGGQVLDDDEPVDDEGKAQPTADPGRTRSVG